MIATYSYLTVLPIGEEFRFCRVFPGLRRVDVLEDESKIEYSLEIKSKPDTALKFAEIMALASFYDLEPMKF